MNASAQILLIDDDRDIIFGASLRLRAAGYQTIAAYDGEEGIHAARQNHPDAIVLDVRMPRMDGLVALDRLRENRQTRSIPVVIVSASLVDQRAALDSGARFFLAKPYQGEALLAAIQSVLNEPRSSPLLVRDTSVQNNSSKEKATSFTSTKDFQQDGAL